MVEDEGTAADGDPDAPPEEETTMPTGGINPTARIAIWIGVALLGLAFGAAGVLLLTSGASDAGSEVMALDRAPKGDKYESFDALVINASDTRMELLTRDNRREQLFIRKPDRPHIDVLHAQSHAALGQPVRVYWTEVDGKRVIVFLEDAPTVFR